MSNTNYWVNRDMITTYDGSSDRYWHGVTTLATTYFKSYGSHSGTTSYIWRADGY